MRKPPPCSAARNVRSTRPDWPSTIRREQAGTSARSSGRGPRSRIDALAGTALRWFRPTERRSEVTGRGHSLSHAEAVEELVATSIEVRAAGLRLRAESDGCPATLLQVDRVGVVHAHLDLEQ